MLCLGTADHMHRVGGSQGSQSVGADRDRAEMQGGFPSPPCAPETLPLGQLRLLHQGVQEGYQLLQAQFRETRRRGPGANKASGELHQVRVYNRQLPVTGRREAGAEWIHEMALLSCEPHYHQQCQAAPRQGRAGELMVASCLSALNTVSQGFKEWFHPSTNDTVHQREPQSSCRVFIYNST